MSDVVAVKGGMLFDGSGEPPVEGGIIVVKDGVIEDVGPGKEVNIPEGAQIVDASGKTVLPGLMDLHVHIFQMVGPLDYHERYLIPKSLTLLYAAKHAKQLLEACLLYTSPSPRD